MFSKRVHFLRHPGFGVYGCTCARSAPHVFGKSAVSGAMRFGETWGIFVHTLPFTQIPRCAAQKDPDSPKRAPFLGLPSPPPVPPASPGSLFSSQNSSRLSNPRRLSAPSPKRRLSVGSPAHASMMQRARRASESHSRRLSAASREGRRTSDSGLYDRQGSDLASRPLHERRRSSLEASFVKSLTLDRRRSSADALEDASSFYFGRDGCFTPTSPASGGLPVDLAAEAPERRRIINGVFDAWDLDGSGGMELQGPVEGVRGRVRGRGRGCRGGRLGQ